MSGNFDIKALQGKMQQTCSILTEELRGLRTGRATPDLLSPLRINVYGALTPLQQISTLNAPDARTLSVQVWDQSLVKSIEKCILESDLGLNPRVEGNTIFIQLPELTKERRQDLSKICAKYGEKAKVATRNIRRDGLEQVKKQEKEGDISEDEKHRFSAEIQKLTDSTIEQIDKMVTQKAEEILHV